MTYCIDVERWLPRPGRDAADRDVRIQFDGECEIIGTGCGKAKGLAMRPPVNAHDHGFGVRPLDFGCIDTALEPWIASLSLRPPTDPYLEALVAFGRLLRNGCAATIHCHNSLKIRQLEAEAAAVAKAAKDCGIRLALSCPLLDTSPMVYGGMEEFRKTLQPEEASLIEEELPSPLPAADQVALVGHIASAHSGSGIDVQFGPIGPQWCSDELLQLTAEASAASGRQIHMHLLESQRQPTWLNKRFPGGVVAHLDRIGFLSPRLTVAHGVGLRAAECELLAARGVTVASNPSVNLRLRSGTAPVADFLGRGLDFAIGLDGMGFDDDQDIWRELRLFRMLHGGSGLKPGISNTEIFKAVTETGRHVVNQSDRGDLVVLNYEELIRDSVFDDLDEAEVLLTRMTGINVTDLFVSGRQIVKEGQILTFDFAAARAELRRQSQRHLPQLTALRAKAKLISGAIENHYLTLYP
ncbi:MAG: amidohydrolase family protein [Rhodobacteraceae bacterium]|nr:amidohydrolase family protein [Paracoccaceae bacterium]